MTHAKSRNTRFALLAVLTCGLILPAIGGEKSTRRGTHWAYQGKGGPANWGELNPEFQTCRIGKMQTPVDLTAATADQVSDVNGTLTTEYQSVPLKIVNNGHTIQVNVAPGNFMIAGGKRFELRQFHFHTPSEHTVDGKTYPMEVHLVHKDADGKLGVLGVFLQTGTTSPALQSIWNNLPKTLNRELQVQGATFDLNALLPAGTDLYTYNGSLTTPPCSEGVQWFVLAQPIEISAQNVKQFVKLLGHNARPVQPLNGRTIQTGEKVAGTTTR
jgi:carbonic anhydrase